MAQFKKLFKLTFKFSTYLRLFRYQVDIYFSTYLWNFIVTFTVRNIVQLSVSTWNSSVRIGKMRGMKFLLALAMCWSCIQSDHDGGRSIGRLLESHSQLVVVERDEVVLFVKGRNSASKPFLPEHNHIGWNRRRTDRRSSPGRCSRWLVLNWIGVQPG